MPALYNPLATMKLRNDAGLRDAVGATFGKVRNGGTRNHQGWDLYAPVATPIFALGSGFVVWTHESGAYGKQLLLQFNRDGSFCACDSTQTVFAFYAHLSEVSVEEGQFVTAGQAVGRTGVSGNAEKKYPHLHFEIRLTSDNLGKGLVGRINPGEILGYQLLSCQAETQSDGTDTVDMVCRAPDLPTEIAPAP